MFDERILIVRGDLTEQQVDAVVNAANNELRPGGGVDGALNRAAGPRLAEAMKGLGGCRTGDAKLTEAFDLPAKYVIHTVGPVWRGGDREEEDRLAECYRSVFRVAKDIGARTLAFPSISTGAYGFPLRRAVHIAVHEVAVALDDDPDIQEVRFVCFDEETAHAYERELQMETQSPEVL